MPKKISIRISGPFPVGKFEFECECGRMHFEKIEKGEKEKIFKCDKCGKKIMVSDHGDHYHIFIEMTQ